MYVVGEGSFKGLVTLFRPVGSIRKVVKLVSGPKEIAARGSGGALQAPPVRMHFLESERQFWQQNCYVTMKSSPASVM